MFPGLCQNLSPIQSGFRDRLGDSRGSDQRLCKARGAPIPGEPPQTGLRFE